MSKMTMSGKTIGNSPLDTVVPRREPESDTPIPSDATERQQAREEGPSRVAKERLTVHLPVELIDRVKNIVYWTPGLSLLRSLSRKRLRSGRRSEGNRSPTALRSLKAVGR